MDNSLVGIGKGLEIAASFDHLVDSAGIFLRWSNLKLARSKLDGAASLVD